MSRRPPSSTLFPPPPLFRRRTPPRDPPPQLGEQLEVSGAERCVRLHRQATRPLPPRRDGRVDDDLLAAEQRRPGRQGVTTPSIERHVHLGHPRGRFGGGL